MKEVRCSTCGATLFWNQACDQYQHKEEWRNRDHFPACDYNNSVERLTQALAALDREAEA